MEYEVNRTSSDTDGPVTVTDSSPKQAQSGDSPDGKARYTDSFVRRKVSVKGAGGVAATVVVTAQRGQVWVSIQPLFTWEAIMEHGKVDELMRTLGLAQEDARKMVSKNLSWGSRQPASNGTVAPGSKASHKP